MPCNILEVTVRIGQNITVGKSGLITEAMNMETEIAAPINLDEILIES